MTKITPPIAWSLNGWTEEATKGPLLLARIEYPSKGSTGRKGPVHHVWAFHKGFHAPPDEAAGRWVKWWKSRRDGDLWNAWDKANPWYIVVQTSRSYRPIMSGPSPDGMRNGKQYLSKWLTEQTYKGATVISDVAIAKTMMVEEGRTGPIASPSEIFADLIRRNNKKGLVNMKAALVEIDQVLLEMQVLVEFRDKLAEKIRKQFE